MPEVYRADVPLATERQTIGKTTRSHILHAHHYRSESNRKFPDSEFAYKARVLQGISWPIRFALWAFFCSFINPIACGIFVVLTLWSISIMICSW